MVREQRGFSTNSKLGRNFDDFAQAMPGDFMKIFWSSEVGKYERGHSVIFLGMEKQYGLDYVRFWSSNIPLGYGIKTVPRSKIIHAIFSQTRDALEPDSHKRCADDRFLSGGPAHATFQLCRSKSEMRHVIALLPAMSSRAKRGTSQAILSCNSRGSSLRSE